MGFVNDLFNILQTFHKYFLNYENFELGRHIEGAQQLKPRLIPGGTALIEQPYVLRQSFMM